MGHTNVWRPVILLNYWATVQMLTYYAIVVNIYDLIGSSENSFPADQAADATITERHRRPLVINKEMNWNFKHC